MWLQRTKEYIFWLLVHEYTLTLSSVATLRPCQIIPYSFNYSSLWYSITPAVVDVMCLARLLALGCLQHWKTLTRTFTLSYLEYQTSYLYHCSSVLFLSSTFFPPSLFSPTSISQQFQLTIVMESSALNQTGLNAQCSQTNGSHKAE